MNANEPRELPADCYLGDGVYASFDGFSVWLDCRAQPELSLGLNGPGIALEPTVLRQLISYAQKCGVLPKGESNVE